MLPTLFLSCDAVTAANRRHADFAYATLLSDTEANSFKRQFVASAVVWCASIRHSYTDEFLAATSTSPPKSRSLASLPFDVVLLIRGKLSDKSKESLAGCFDRIIPVQDFGRTPSGVADSAYNSIVRAKLWAFSLTEYKRVQFMDADQMIIRNLDHYFFRHHYMVTGTDVREATVPVRKFYTQVSIQSPVCSAFFSFEPDRRTVVDLMSIFDIGRWNTVDGWMDYGAYDFPYQRIVESFADPLQPSCTHTSHLFLVARPRLQHS